MDIFDIEGLSVLNGMWKSMGTTSTYMSNRINVSSPPCKICVYFSELLC